MSHPRDDCQHDLFRPSLEKIINLRHRCCVWRRGPIGDILAGRFSSVCRLGPGQPPLPTRLVVGLFILKHMHYLSGNTVITVQSDEAYTEVNELTVGQLLRKDLVTAKRIGDCREDSAALSALSDLKIEH